MESLQNCNRLFASPVHWHSQPWLTLTMSGVWHRDDAHLISAWKETQTGCPSMLPLIPFQPIFSWDAFESQLTRPVLAAVRSSESLRSHSRRPPSRCFSGTPQGGGGRRGRSLCVFSHTTVSKQVKISRRHPLPFHVDPICCWKGKWGVGGNSLSWQGSGS